jgi:hypothetical protein
MDAVFRAIGKLSLLFVPPLLATVLAAANTCLAECADVCSTECCSAGCCGCRWCPFIDDSTLYAWSRTWHGVPNTLETPLRDYYIPRTPAGCDFEDYAGHFDGSADRAVLERTPEALEDAGVLPLAEMGLEPARFERLGSLPNDMELAPGPPAGGAGPVSR